MKPILLSMLLLAGCASLPVADAFEGPARLGRTVRVDGPLVRPIRVIEDSRCPANARCIWAGRVVVHVQVRTGGQPRTIDLTLGDAGEPVADGRLRLTSVAPEKYGKPIAPADYRFGFEFQGGL